VMCESCFDEQWEGRSPQAYLRYVQAMAPGRHAAMRSVLTSLRATEASPGWACNALHVAVNNDNYEYGCCTYPGARPWTGAEVALCSAWEALSVDERSIVVGWYHEYCQLVG